MAKNIPFFSLDRQYKSIKAQLQNSVINVLDSKKFIGGPFVQEFEQKFKNYTKSNYAISCNSGTDALWIALKALGLKQNSIVLTTPFSFIASSSEIVAHSAHPVFIDIEKNSYNIDPEKIKLWLEKNTINKDGKTIHKQTNYEVVGILPVDIFGQCANYAKIKKIANEWNLWIVEDAAQAVGAKTNEKQTAGNLGDISCFSFYPTKNLGACGDGGCCTTNNEYLAEKLIQLRNHGRTNHYNYVQHGINSRLDAVQATILTEKLTLLDELNNKRNLIAQIYNEKLSNLDCITLPITINGEHVYHQYCIKIDGLNREQFANELKENGIGTNIYYPKALDQIEFLNTDKRLKTECPISQNLTLTILALPVWPELEQQEVEYVCDTIKNIVLKMKSINLQHAKTPQDKQNI